uniref:Transcription initiation factor IIE subunit beta n=1 Tax=Caenorhabditis japonica TaxID=281687 RepID=A0A8R1IAV2_CAEJA
MEQVAAEVIVVSTQVNKKKDRVIFYNDKDFAFPELEDDFKALWRNVSVDHLDEKKIEEYLQKKGLDAMKDLTPKVRMPTQLKRKAAKRRMNQKVQNEHMDGVLEDYE